MLHAWRGYERYAWGRDELCPLTQTGKDSFGGLGATLVDSLDTLHMMGGCGGRAAFGWALGAGGTLGCSCAVHTRRPPPTTPQPIPHTHLHLTPPPQATCASTSGPPSGCAPRCPAALPPRPRPPLRPRCLRQSSAWWGACWRPTTSPETKRCWPGKAGGRVGGLMGGLVGEWVVPHPTTTGLPLPAEAPPPPPTGVAPARGAPPPPPLLLRSSSAQGGWLRPAASLVERDSLPRAACSSP